MHRPSVQLLIALAPALAGGCTASYPSAPSPASSTAIVIRHPQLPSSNQMYANNVVRFIAYTLNTDEVYADITGPVAWTSSNPAVLVLNSSTFANALFITKAAGTSEVRASYGGMTGTLAVAVRPPVERPYLVAWPGGPSNFAFFYPSTSAYSNEEVGKLAVWTSSDPTILQIDAQGKMTPRVPGNVEVTATYSGVSGSFWTSVPPRRTQ